MRSRKGSPEGGRREKKVEGAQGDVNPPSPLSVDDPILKYMRLREGASG
jgi:hypothetical protein